MKITIRGPVFETNSSSEHTFMYLSKETFEKWRRGEVRMRGDYYPVCDLTDDDFITAEKKPDTVYGPQTNIGLEEEWMCECLNAVDSPAVQADLLYVLRKYFVGKKYNRIDFGKWNGSYVSMLLTFLRHHGDCVSIKDANKRHVDPEEWGLAKDEIAMLRNALFEIEGWEGINNEKYSEFCKIVNDLRNKEEITAEDLLVLWNIMYFEMNKQRIDDEKFRAFESALCKLEDHDVVYQNAHMDVIDNGKKVRIHIWGRDDG